MVTAIIDFHKYPFLKHVEDELSQYAGGVAFYDLLTTDNYYLQKAKERIELIRTDGDLEPYQNIREPIIVFYVEICLAISSQDELLKAKLINREAKSIGNQLPNENEETLLAIARLLDVKANAEKLTVHQIVNGKNFMVQFKFSMTLNNFLKVLRETRRFEELYSQGVKIASDKVYLTKEKLVTLLVYKVKDLFYEMIYGDRLGTIKTQCIKIN